MNTKDKAKQNKPASAKSPAMKDLRVQKGQSSKVQGGLGVTGGNAGPEDFH